MKKFDEFNITVATSYLAGDKIKIDKTLNREITIEAFKIGPSKFEGKGPCLHLQFQMNGNQYVCFGSFSRLIEQIKQVPDDGFPFTTTVVKENNVLKFT
jgi:hypothetical protein